jgi:hypothetical protein
MKASCRKLGHLFSSSTTTLVNLKGYRLHEPRSRRVTRADAKSRAWIIRQRAGVCSAGGGGTEMCPRSKASSSSRSRARVWLQYLGASSR